MAHERRQRLGPAFATGCHAVCAGVTIAGYVALLAGIRAPEGFERAAGPLGMAS